MKKLVRNISLMAALAVVPSFAYADEGDGNGIFVGINMGTSISFSTKITPEQQNTTKEISTNAPSHMNIGFKVGYNYYFLEFLGVRGYFDYSYGFNVSNSEQVDAGQSTIKKGLGSFHQFGVNADVMANIFRTDNLTFGVFAGIGAGYATASSSSTESNVTTETKLGSGFVLPVNIGFMLVAGSNHAFELGMKIPTLSISHSASAQQGDPVTTTNTRLMSVNMGYSFIF